MSSEVIPAITYTHVTEKKVEDLLIKKYQNKRIVKYFINDIFNAKCNGKYYEFKNQVFKTVMVRGTIVSISPYGEKYRITVDDGTGQIECFLEKNEELEMLRQEVTNELNECTDLFKLDADDVLLRVSVMLLRSTQNRLNKFICYKDYKLGDNVQFIGNLSDYNDKRYCFITNIMKNTSSDVTADVQYLNNLFDLYENYYDNSL